MCLDVANPPSGIKVVAQTPGEVTLAWNPPTSDGGSKVSGYNVEIRDPETDEWYPVNESLIKGNSFTGFYF